MSVDDLTIFYYDHYPKLYGSLTAHPVSQRVMVALLVDYAEERGNLKRLAKQLGLPVPKKKKKKRKKKKAKPQGGTVIKVGNIGGNLSGNIAGGDITDG